MVNLQLKPFLKQAIKWTLCILVLWFVYFAMRGQIARIQWSEVHFNIPLLLLSGACLIAMGLMRAMTLHYFLAAYHQRMPLRVVLGVAWLPQLGKYLPGKFGSIAGGIWLLRNHGVSGAAAVSAIGLVGGFSILTSVVIASPLLTWHPVLKARFPAGTYLAAVLIVVAIVCMHPRVFAFMVNALMRMLKRQPLQMLPRLHQYIAPLLTTFGQWLFAGLALWCATASIGELPLRHVPLFIAGAALGLTVGYLALFAPAGIGVRELVFVSVLGAVAGPTIAIAALLLRLLHTIVDLLLAATGAILLRESRSRTVAADSGADATVAIAK